MRKRFHYVVQGLKLILGAMAICSLVVFANQFKLAHHFPIKKVQIYGLVRTDHKEIQAALSPLVNKSFFATNVAAIRNRLLHMPWIAKTSVRRVWPDAIQVKIVEKNALAIWNDQSLLSSAGDLFSASRNSYPEHLPSFSGPEGKQVYMLQYFNQMNRLLLPLHAKISILELTPYSTWKLKLDNGMVLRTGHHEVLTRLSHFVKVYDKIIGDRVEDVDYVDLRYSNGVAVRWKTPMKTFTGTG